MHVPVEDSDATVDNTGRPFNLKEGYSVIIFIAHAILLNQLEVHIYTHTCTMWGVCALCTHVGSIENDKKDSKIP